MWKWRLFSLGGSEAGKFWMVLSVPLEAHLYFVTIHPFDDGNGRLARTLTDMALARDEGTGRRYYSLSAQIMKERAANSRHTGKDPGR
jgi:fido (protein-threonine AMPylation protein)